MMEDAKTLYLKKAYKETVAKIEGTINSYLKQIGTTTNNDPQELVQKARLEDKKTALKEALEYMIQEATAEKLPTESMFQFQDFSNH